MRNQEFHRGSTPRELPTSASWQKSACECVTEVLRPYKMKNGSEGLSWPSSSTDFVDISLR